MIRLRTERLEQVIRDYAEAHNKLDARTCVWEDVRLIYFNNHLNLTGLIDSIGAPIAEALTNELGQLVINVMTKLCDDQFGIVSQAYVNLRRTPKHQAELISQLSLGWPLTKLREEGDWIQVKSHLDGYIGWMHKAGIHEISADGLSEFLQSVIGTLRQPITLTVAPYRGLHDSITLRAGCLIVKPVSVGGAGGSVGVTAVSVLPDQKMVTLTALQDNALGQDMISLISKQEAQVPTQSDNQPDHEPSYQADNLESIYQDWLGTPYLWGGNTPNGLDCSGFIQLYALCNGYFAPRDADQQFRQAGYDQPLDIALLQPYDLLFFAELNKKVSHVALHIADGRFVHADSMLRYNSLHPHSHDYAPHRHSTWVGIGKLSNFTTADLNQLNRPITY